MASRRAQSTLASGTALCQAARELGRLPELVEASRLCAANDHNGALHQLERAAQVMEMVPVPAMKLAAQGALAQVMRSAGQLGREREVWSNLLASGVTPELRLHALSGAVCASLHQGDAETALARCDEASALCEAPATVITFAVHRALALALDGAPTTAASPLEAAVEAVATAKEAGLTHDEAWLASLLAGAQLLAGDALAAAGRDTEAIAQWELVLGEREVASTGNMTQPDGGDRGHAARRVAALSRLGRQALARGELDHSQQRLQEAVR